MPNPIHYPPHNKRESALYWLYEQRRFMAERGTTLAGYLAHYAAQRAERGSDDAEYAAYYGMTPDQHVTAIWHADHDELIVVETRAEMVTGRKQ